MKPILLFLLLTFAVHADAITELKIKGVNVHGETFKIGVTGLEVKEDQLDKYFKKDAIKTIKKSIDFTKQKLVVIAWQGSGRDSMNYVIKESYPEQILFDRKRGRTKDLRSHLRVFILRKNVSWSSK